MAWAHPMDLARPGDSRILSCSQDFVRTTLRCYNKGSSSSRKQEPSGAAKRTSFAGLVARLQQQQNLKGAESNALERPSPRAQPGPIEGLKSASQQHKKSNSSKKVSTDSDLKKHLAAPVSTPDLKSEAKASSDLQKNGTESEKKSPEGFSEAVIDAWRQAALEQKQKEIEKRQRKMSKNKKPAAEPEENQTPLKDGKPIVLKPEWAAKIRQLEEQLESLKQQYYKKF